MAEWIWSQINYCSSLFRAPNFHEYPMVLLLWCSRICVHDVTYEYSVLCWWMNGLWLEDAYMYIYLMVFRYHTYTICWRSLQPHAAGCMPFCDTAVMVLLCDRVCACLYKGIRYRVNVFGPGVLLVTRAQVSGDKGTSQHLVLRALKRGNGTCPCWKGWVSSVQGVIDNFEQSKKMPSSSEEGIYDISAFSSIISML